ncbi:MAG TPA: hypothetical protein VGM39_09830 [Kofleriaceae bacterium]|jgi:hypothetical protein
MRYLLVLSLFLAACSSKKGSGSDLDATEAKHLAQLCVDASGVLGEKMSDDEYRKAMSTVMTGCAKACDAKQANACAILDDQVGRLCKVSSEVCGKLCDPTHPGALTDSACKAQKASAKSP